MTLTEHAAAIEAWRRRCERLLERLLPPPESDPATLQDAMRYAALSGGKRFRPVLVYAAGTALGLEPGRLDPVATAIELIHAYSLVHDDLPAMDDDDLRRGQPTCHRAFDEATAILAGDALQALAFEVLANELDAEKPDGLRVIGAIAQACGFAGMAGGQALDLNAVGKHISSEQLETMHRLKTGALIRAAVTTPAIMAGADEVTLNRLGAYGDCIGLAFQVHDDILDVSGNSAVIGKQTCADQALDKPTFPSVLGLEESHRRARELRDAAIGHLEGITGDTALLAWLADYVIQRDR
jgi:geranylgeranyl pyrophosphate synthase